VRAPLQVLVLPFRVAAGGGHEFAAQRRSDDGAWQFIAGGAEVGETPLAAARREAREEAGLTDAAVLTPLQTQGSVSVGVFPKDRGRWMAEGVWECPEHCFAVDVTGHTLRLSAEHTELRWGPEPDIARLVRYDSNRAALWELARRPEHGAF